MSYNVTVITKYGLGLLFILIFIQLFIYYTVLLLCLTSIFIGSVYGVILAINQSKQYQPVNDLDRQGRVINSILKDLQNKQTDEETVKNLQKPVSSSSSLNTVDLDKSIDELCDLLINDLILSWYKHVSYQQTIFTKAFKQEIHKIVNELKIRCRVIDWVAVLSNDFIVLLTEHFQKVKQASLNPNIVFQLHSFLVTEESENECLRSLCESVLLLLLPNYYALTSASRHLLREVLVFNVVRPTFDKLCEPDYLNEQLLSFLQKSDEYKDQKERKFNLASNYENFMKLIQTCDQLDKLEELWESIVTEIMQATAIKNLLKEGVISKDSPQKHGTKGELLMSRDLTKYLNQLRIAKSVCERRITANGGRSYLLLDSTTSENVSNRKVLSLNIILSCQTGRFHFQQFLETLGTHALIKFWYDVWKLRSAMISERHRVASNIYKTYILQFGSAVRDEIDNATVNEMKIYLIGEKVEPDAFYLAQTIIYNVLQKDYYGSFIVSEYYSKFCKLFDSNDIKDFDLNDPSLINNTVNISPNDLSSTLSSPNSETMVQSTTPDVDSPIINAESVPKRLQDLRVHLATKVYACEAAKEVATFDTKTVKKLEQDIHGIQMRISTLESLIENVDLWWDHLGHWKAKVLSDVIENGSSCLAVLIRTDVQWSSGWVVTRTIHAWQEFYLRLKQLKSSLPTIDLFRTRTRKFSIINDSITYKKLTEQLQDFLQEILKDEHMSSYELVYQFLNPSIVDNDQQAYNNSLKGGVLSQIFRNKTHVDTDDQDYSEIDSVRFLEGRADSIAKPLYQLINEIFEVKGMLKLVRITLVQFIRSTFGSTINRQTRRLIFGLFQENRLVSYVTMLRDTFWPNGSTLSIITKETRTDDEKLERRHQAKRKLLTSIPETFSLLIGYENTRGGVERLFELFQDGRLNKHFFYNILLMIIGELFPEIRLKERLQNDD